MPPGGGSLAPSTRRKRAVMFSRHAPYAGRAMRSASESLSAMNTCFVTPKNGVATCVLRRSGSLRCFRSDQPPRPVRGPSDALRLGVAVGDEYLLRHAEERSRDLRVEAVGIVAMLLPLLAVDVGELANPLVGPDCDDVDSTCCDRRDTLRRVRWIPEWRMRLLQRTQLHRHVAVVIELAFVGQRVVRQSGHDSLERFLEHRLRLVGINSSELQLEWHDAAPDANLEPSAAQVVKHANLFDQPRRRIEREHVAKRSEMDPAGALRHGRQEQSGRGRVADRTEMMFGEMIAVEASAVREFDQLQAIFIDLGQRRWPRVDPVKEPELHLRFSYPNVSRDEPSACNLVRRLRQFKPSPSAC